MKRTASPNTIVMRGRSRCIAGSSSGIVALVVVFFLVVLIIAGIYLFHPSAKKENHEYVAVNPRTVSTPTPPRQQGIKQVPQTPVAKALFPVDPGDSAFGTQISGGPLPLPGCSWGMQCSAFVGVLQANGMSLRFPCGALALPYFPDILEAVFGGPGPNSGSYDSFFGGRFHSEDYQELADAGMFYEFYRGHLVAALIWLGDADFSTLLPKISLHLEEVREWDQSIDQSGCPLKAEIYLGKNLSQDGERVYVIGFPDYGGPGKAANLGFCIPNAYFLQIRSDLLKTPARSPTAVNKEVLKRMKEQYEEQKEEQLRQGIH